jgi:hypothetical protein
MVSIPKTLPTLLAVAALPLSALGCGGTPGEAAVDPPAGWTTYRDAGQRLSVSLPSDWHRARQSLTPTLQEPREIISIASYPLRYEPHSRCQVPGCPLPAVDGLGRGDVLISIQERRSGAAHFPARRRPLRQEPMVLGFGAGKRWLCAKRRLERATWTAFGDAGRAFYVFVGFGRGVTPETRREVRRVLGSLRFSRR